MIAQQTHLDAALTRIEDAAGHVKTETVNGLEVTVEAQKTLCRQQAETEQVAAAVHEMSQTVGEVSSNVQHTAHKPSLIKPTCLRLTLRLRPPGPASMVEGLR